MNHFTTSYINSIQMLGMLMIFGIATYAVKQMLLKAEDRIEKVNVKVED